MLLLFHANALYCTTLREMCTHYHPRGVGLLSSQVRAAPSSSDWRLGRMDESGWCWTSNEAAKPFITPTGHHIYGFVGIYECTACTSVPIRGYHLFKYLRLAEGRDWRKNGKCLPVFLWVGWYVLFISSLKLWCDVIPMIRARKARECAVQHCRSLGIRQLYNIRHCMLLHTAPHREERQNGSAMILIIELVLSSGGYHQRCRMVEIGYARMMSALRNFVEMKCIYTVITND